jgi:hypothetical protein
MEGQGRRSKQLLDDHNTLWRTRFLQTSRKTVPMMMMMMMTMMMIMTMMMMINVKESYSIVIAS